MKKSEVQAFVRNTAIEELGLQNCGTLIGKNKYAVPVQTPENGTVYATVTISCTNFASTEKTEAFDLEKAISDYEEDTRRHAEEMAAKAAARAAEREAKKAAKQATAE